MSLIDRFVVTPYHAQLGLGDPSAREYPLWTTGDEPAVANTQCVAVATRGDADGDVTVELHDGHGAPIANAQLAFAGEILLTGDCFAVGSYLGGEDHRFAMPRGCYRVEVYALPRNEPAREIFIHIDAQP